MEWWILAVLGVVILLIPTAYAGKIGAPYAPTRIKAVRRAFDELDIDAADTVVDLGAGDGKILIEAARRGAKAYGYELSPIMWAITFLRTVFKPKAAVRFGNFYKQDISDATVIFAFLMPENMPRVREYIRKQSIPKGQFFLAYAFPFKEVEPVQVIREKNCAALYVYNLSELTSNSK